MKIVSWNVNGLRAVNKRGDLQKLIEQETPSIVCLQEIKCNDEVAAEVLAQFKDTYPYIYYSTSTVKKGYSGTAILSTVKPSLVNHGLPEDLHENHEGRVITCHFEKPYMFTLVNVYTPNSGAGTLARLSYRTQEWDTAFNTYIQSLKSSSPRCSIIVCGDLNVAHHDIDIHNPKTNKRSAGFTDEERHAFGTLLQTSDLVDVFRFLHPTTVKYSWWSNLSNARERNKGWRIDYFLATKPVLAKMEKEKYFACDILTEFKGSDHAPIVLDDGLH